MKGAHVSLILTISIVLVANSNTAKILVVLPMPAWSHYMQYELLWMKLAERGHQITLYSKFGPKQNVTNIKHIKIELPVLEAQMGNFNPNDVPPPNWELGASIFLALFGFNATIGFYQTQVFRDLLASSDEYDLVITEAFFALESTVAFGHRFNAPTIALCTYGIADNSLDAMGNPYLPSFMPDFRSSYTDTKSLWQRLRGWYVLVGSKIIRDFYCYPKHEALITKYFGPDYPSLDSMLRNISLTFLYTNKALSTPVPLLPNLIPVGGMHLKKPSKLPQDLQKITDNAKNGFIYVSFGSVVNPMALDAPVKQAMLNTFKKVNLPILWKVNITEDDPTVNSKTIPKNVIHQKWFPQTDILAHPNIKLFITHGGISSTMEASSIGVPVLGFPFFGDQHHNMQLIMERGYGLIEDVRNLNEKGFYQKIRTILDDPTFKENAQKWSKISNDHLVSPVDTSVYWVEYVLRHNGAPHLSAASRKLYWFELYSLDVVVIIAVIFYVIYKALRFLFSLCCGKSNRNITKAKKKN